MAFGGYWQSGWREFYEDARRANVLVVEMEAGVIMVLTRIWGLRGGAVALVVDDVFEATNEQFVPEESCRANAHHVERRARGGCETLRIHAS